MTSSHWGTGVQGGVMSPFNIDVLDHIVLARNGFVSLRERHLGFPQE